MHLQLQEPPGVWPELPHSTAGELQLHHTHPKGHPGQGSLGGGGEDGGLPRFTDFNESDKFINSDKQY